MIAHDSESASTLGGWPTSVATTMAARCAVPATSSRVIVTWVENVRPSVECIGLGIRWLVAAHVRIACARTVEGSTPLGSSSGSVRVRSMLNAPQLGALSIRIRPV